MNFDMENVELKEKLREKFISFDKTFLIFVLILMGIGFLMAFSAFPYSANRIGIAGFTFTKKYLVYAGLSFIIMGVFATTSTKRIKQLGILGFLGLLVLLVSTHIIGIEIKGAKRWIDFGLTNIQPSEILKPFYIIINAILIVRFKKLWKKKNIKQARNLGIIILAIFGFIAMNIFLQPDLGMTLIFLVIFASQIFIAGLPWRYIFACIGMAVGLIFFAYFTLPHVNKRINTFLHPELSDTYQIDSALITIKNANFLPSSSNVLKKNVPDIHTDFVLAAVFENMGIIGGLGLLILIAGIIIRGFKIIKLRLIKDDFALFVAFPLMMVFFVQCLINIGGCLRMIPSKGATLPFISYGGSSYICFAVVFGLLLNLTRKYNFDH